MLKNFHNAILAAFFLISCFSLIIFHEVKTNLQNAVLVEIVNNYIVGVGAMLFLVSVLCMIDFTKTRLVPFIKRMSKKISNARNSSQR